MTDAFRDMLALFRCGVFGNDYQLQHELDIERVIRLAYEQGVWQTVFLPIVKLQQQSAPFDCAVIEPLRHRMMGEVARNAQRLHKVHETLALLEQKGVRCIVFKGEAVARFYHSPHARISGDTDVLIDPKKERQAVALFQQLGFEVERRGKNAHHFSCRHPEAGLIEVHVALYRKSNNDILFADKIHYTEQPVMFAVDDVQLYTLGYQDGLLYLTCHLIRHFLKQGIGIRQVMDLLLYMQAFEDRLDWESYNALMEELQFGHLIACLRGIGKVYFGMELSGPCETDERLLEQLLTDFEQGGVFGKKERQRQAFYQVYTKHRYEQRMSGDYQAYIARHHDRTVLETIVPGKVVMKRQFAYLKKMPWLLPLAYVQRWGGLLWGLLFRKGKASKPKEEWNDATKKRMDLLQQLDML